MEKYLLHSKNKYFLELNKVKDKLGQEKRLEYMYKYESKTSKPNFEYALLINEIVAAFPFILKSKSWLNICCSPGDYDNYLHHYLKNAKGSGVTLSPAKGGMDFIYKIPDYKLYYYDIIHDNVELPETYDMIITGCLNMNLKNKKTKDTDLAGHSFMIGFKWLKLGGTFVFKTSTKHIDSLPHYYYWMNKCFDKVYSYKSPHILTHRSVFYIIGQGYRGCTMNLNVIFGDDLSYIEPEKEEVIPLMEDIFKQQTNIIKTLLEEVQQPPSPFHYSNKEYWIHFTRGKKIPTIEQEYGFYQEYSTKPVEVIADYLSKHKWSNTKEGILDFIPLEYPKEYRKLPKNIAIRYSVFPKKFHHRIDIPLNITRFLEHHKYTELFTSTISHELSKYAGLFYDIESSYGSKDLNDPSLGNFYVNMPMISREFVLFMINALSILYYRKRRNIVIINGIPVRTNIAVNHQSYECRGEFIESNKWTREKYETHKNMQLIIIGDMPEEDINFLLFCIKTNKIISTLDGN